MNQEKRIEAARESLDDYINLDEYQSKKSKNLAVLQINYALSKYRSPESAISALRTHFTSQIDNRKQLKSENFIEYTDRLIQNNEYTFCLDALDYIEHQLPPLVSPLEARIRHY